MFRDGHILSYDLLKLKFIVVTEDIKKKNRRRLLKLASLGAGSAAVCEPLPKNWSAPLVRMVVLPAHAQTTQTEQEGVEEVTTSPQPEPTTTLCVEIIETPIGPVVVPVPCEEIPANLIAAQRF